MKRSKDTLGRILLPILFGLTLNANACDELWSRSVSLVKQSELMIPGEMVVEQHITDGKGVTQLESTTVVGVAEDKGKIHAELISFTENGQDRTQKSKKEIEESVNEDINDFAWEMPYHVDDPDRFIKGKHEGTHEVHGVACVGYDFEVCDKDFEKTAEPFRFVGTVWIDPASAIPLQIESHLQDLPQKEDGAEIVSLSQYVDFSYSNGVWKREQEKQELCVNARFLFKSVVAVVHTDTHYSKHWKFSVN